MKLHCMRERLKHVSWETKENRKLRKYERTSDCYLEKQLLLQKKLLVKFRIGILAADGSFPSYEFNEIAFFLPHRLLSKAEVRTKSKVSLKYMVLVAAIIRGVKGHHSGVPGSLALSGDSETALETGPSLAGGCFCLQILLQVGSHWKKKKKGGKVTGKSILVY